MTDVSTVAAGLPRTIPVYWKDSYQMNLNSGIIRSVHDEKRYWYLVLDETIFHPKGGGQPSDRGILEGQGFRFEVKKSMLARNAVVVHWGKAVEGTPAEGPVRTTIDWDWRFLMMRRHTTAHLLDHCLAQAIGSGVEAWDSWLGDPCYVAYKGKSPFKEQLVRAEELENQIISKGALVRSEEVDEGHAKRLLGDLRSSLLPAGMERVRLVTIEGCKPIACGGTHLRNVSEARGVRLGRVESLDEGFRVHFDVA